MQMDMAASEPPMRKRSGMKFFFIGWVVIFMVFGGLAAWSVFAPFEGAVLASGSVTVENENKAVQHLEGGIVAEILVSEGSEVESGELLIRLDGTAIEAQLASLDAQLTDLIAREARLKAERDGRRNVTPRNGADAITGTPEMQDALKSQDTLLKARARSRATQVDILNQRIQQLERKVEGLKAEVISKSQQSLIIDEEVRGLEELEAEGLTPKSRLLALRRERSALEGAAESLRSEIAATEVQMGEARLEKLRLTEGFREEVIGELTEVQTELASLLQERTAAVDRLGRLDIRASRSGRVLGVRTHTVGGVIQGGEPIMHIVPRDDRLVATVRILPQDIDKITEGQVARLRFSAFSMRETPEVEGTVLKVSADAVVDENSGMSYYEVVVELPSQAPLGGRFALVPGMPVDAMLKTESRNVLSYLTKPLTDSLTKTFRE
jgi:HlyD family type I secretion membrane fusion protein